MRAVAASALLVGCAYVMLSVSQHLTPIRHATLPSTQGDIVPIIQGEVKNPLAPQRETFHFIQSDIQRLLLPMNAEAAGSGFLTYPFPWHQDMHLVAGWEYGDGTHHRAIDYIKGDPHHRTTWQHFDVLAAAPGDACWKHGGGHDPGRTVVIEHSFDGVPYQTHYMHLISVEPEIPRCPERVKVARGAKIAVVGDKSWDRCQPPCVHLHFAVLQAGHPVDPYDIYGQSNRYPQPNGHVVGLMGAAQCWTADPPDHPDEDEMPPSIRFTLPRLNIWYNTDQQLAWTITDQGGSGVKGYNWAWDRDPGGMPPAQRTDRGSTTLSEVGVGVHTICVRAWDGRGNEVFLSHGWWGYDPFPPTRAHEARELHDVPNDTPQSEVNDPEFVWGEATDMASGIAGYHIYWGTIATGTASNWTETPGYDPGPVEPGVYYFRVQAQDVAGNTSPWETLFIFRYEETL